MKKEPHFHKWNFIMPAGTTAVGKLSNVVVGAKMGVFAWGAGKSFAAEFLKSLSDDEVVRYFATTRMPNKTIFLHEIQRRGIKSITIDLEGEATEDKIVDVMETGALFFGENKIGGAGMSYFPEMTGIVGHRVRCIDRGESFENLCNELRKSNAHLLKKKKSKFYQELNKNSRGKHRR